jgi:hypothetical protein
MELRNGARCQTLMKVAGGGHWLDRTPQGNDSQHLIYVARLPFRPERSAPGVESSVAKYVAGEGTSLVAKCTNVEDEVSPE